MSISQCKVGHNGQRILVIRAKNFLAKQRFYLIELGVEEINTQRTAHIFLQYRTEVRGYHRIRWSQDCIIYLLQQSRLSTKFLPI